jgi:integrase
VRWLSEAEEATLRKVIEKDYADHLPEFEISLMTGMRQQEQFSLNWEDVDLGSGIISLAETKSGDGRLVHLNSRALAVMRMLHERSLGTGRVFLLNLEPRWFTEAVRKAKLHNFSWHCLRHTFGTRLVRAGVDVKTVQDLGGWKSISMVMRDAHADASRRAPALEKLCEPCATSGATEAQQDEKPVAHKVN